MAIQNKFLPYIRQNKTLSVLVIFSLVFVCLVAIRLGYAQTTHKIFLIWNLFLAWVPILILLPLKKKTPGVLKLFLILIWFIFLPNALYTITDLKHIGYSSNFILYWLDIFLLFAIATLGTALALVGLEYGEIKIKNIYGATSARAAVITAIIISGFGIYLGRFPRLNSWYVFTDPVSVYRTIGESLVSVFTNHYYLFFVAIFSIFYGLLYWVYRWYKKL